MQLSHVAVALAACASPAAAELIISNYPGNDAAYTVIDEWGSSKAMGFKMFETPILIYYEITLRLNISSTDVAPRVEIFDDAGMEPGQSISVLSGPDSYAPGIGDYVFKHYGELAYPQNQPFWLVVSSTHDTFAWMASDPPWVPMGYTWDVEHLGAVYGTYPPANPSDILSTYQIDAWYPAPGTLATFGIGCFALRRRRA